jgi:hypothetical protein
MNILASTKGYFSMVLQNKTNYATLLFFMRFGGSPALTLILPMSQISDI